MDSGILKKRQGFSLGGAIDEAYIPTECSQAQESSWVQKENEHEERAQSVACASIKG